MGGIFLQDYWDQMCSQMRPAWRMSRTPSLLLVAFVSLSAPEMQRWWRLVCPGPGWEWESKAELVFFGTTYSGIFWSSVSSEMRSGGFTTLLYSRSRSLLMLWPPRLVFLGAHGFDAFNSSTSWNIIKVVRCRSRRLDMNKFTEGTLSFPTMY